MKLFGTMKINEQDHLSIGGCDTVDLIKEFGSPLYVIDEDLVRQKCRRFKKAFIDGIPGGEVCYAAKAFTNLAMMRIVSSEGLGVDVVSAGELYTAMLAGCNPERIDFNGNNKTPDEIRFAIENKVGRFIVDNFTEIDLIEKIAGEYGIKQKVLLRTQPGIEAHTHEYIQTGKIDSKFGLSIYTGQAKEAIEKMLSCKNIELMGLHCHIGSQIFEVESFVQAARVMAQYMDKIRKELGVTFPELNMGGGFGIYYNHEDKPTAFNNFAQSMYGALKEEFEALDYPVPSKISIEPGRAIIGNCGTTLYTVGAIKTIPQVRTYVSVDGGMTDNPRPALYQAKYEMALANKMSANHQIVASVAGKCCESGDMLIWDASMPWIETGDILAVASTGAYNYTMSSNYNRLCKPAIVLCSKGKADIIVERETFDDLIRNDVIPERLK